MSEKHESGNQYDITVSNPFFECRVFWARVVSSEHESLLTGYTKHTFYEIQYALEGPIGMTVGEDERLDVPESDFAVIPPDTYHQVVDADSRGARFIMAFSLSVKDARMQELVGLLKCGRSYHQTPNMRPLLELLLGTRRGGALGKRARAVLLESFLLEIFEACRQCRRSATPARAPQADGDTARVEQMQRFIASANGIGISVESLAAHFSMSARHVNRLFHAVTGKSPREVINHERLKKIEEYIVSTDLSLFEIAALCGFCDEYAMNKFFKRYTLSNLSDFRRIAKK